MVWLSCVFCRPHPKVRQIDMLHATDYVNMNYNQVVKKLNENKRNDLYIAKAMQ